ncbi:lysM domain receptor-like kinase 4 [Actinidia eriantha]|uniref:lysM domain receptor-like kinase 4 n=1 Tax=Actinidia eriantha TaxID=165200 RepID=UPI002589B460|nr:lysM domain receptor-like kinase 4 [Actinidia eriantha]
MKQAILCLLTLVSLVSCISTQQEYSGNSVLDCNNSDESKPSPAFLYTCNGLNTTFIAFLMIKSEPPCNSVPTISALASSDSSELARANNFTNLTMFPTGKEVIVPVNCSCLGQYYLANTTFHIPTTHDTYFSIANNTFQGLSTCNSLKRASHFHELDTDLELQIPLRCACPTRKQISEGTKYLLMYSLFLDDNVPDIAERFNVSANSLLEANGFSEEDPTLFPFTTILIPLPTEPSSSNTIKFGVPRNSGEQGKQKLPKDLLVEIASIDKVLRMFKFEELKKGTDNFSSNFQKQDKGFCEPWSVQSGSSGC